METSASIRNALNVQNACVHHLRRSRGNGQGRGDPMEIDRHHVGYHLKDVISFFHGQVHEALAKPSTTVNSTRETKVAGMPVVIPPVLSCVPAVTSLPPSQEGIFDCFFLFCNAENSIVPSSDSNESVSFVSQAGGDHSAEMATCCLAVCLFNLALARHVGCCLDPQDNTTTSHKNKIPSSELELRRCSTLYESAYFLLKRLSALHMTDNSEQESNEPQVPQDPFLSLVCFACCTNLASLYLEWGDLSRVAYWKRALAVQAPPSLLDQTIQYHDDMILQMQSFLTSSIGTGTIGLVGAQEEDFERVRIALQNIHYAALLHGHFAAKAA